MAAPRGSKSLLDKGIKAVSKSLTEFGYPEATEALIRKAHTDWLAGKEATDIIAMFAEREFADHPEIFGKPGESS